MDCTTEEELYDRAVSMPLEFKVERAVKMLKTWVPAAQKLDPELAHIQVSVTTTDAKTSAMLETATAPEGRIWAVDRLTEAGMDAQIRMSPFLPGLVDLDRIARTRTPRMVVEFLRVNSWTRKWLGGYVDLSPYTVKSGGYLHMPLETKVAWIDRIREKTGKEISVCEDEDRAFSYWKERVNPNPDDCCNLKFKGKEPGK